MQLGALHAAAAAAVMRYLRLPAGGSEPEFDCPGFGPPSETLARCSSVTLIA